MKTQTWHTLNDITNNNRFILSQVLELLHVLIYLTILKTVKQMLTGCSVEAAAEAETQRSYEGCRYSIGRTPRVKTKWERTGDSEAGP